jgi:NDP-mannose synthase
MTEMRAIILAGGKGTRLRPVSDYVPKPLVPIAKDTTILGVLLKQLATQGFSHVTLAINHMADQVRAYAGDGKSWGLVIDYVEENKPLHTIGPLTLIEDMPEHVLVVNGDTLTNLNYADFLRTHAASNKDISVVVQKREMHIDFGVLTFDPQTQILTDFQEKPVHTAHVSIGVNCIRRSVIESLPKGEWYGFDSLMKDSLAQGRDVRIHPHEGFWMDVGRPEDYRYVIENYEQLEKLL